MSNKFKLLVGPEAFLAALQDDLTQCRKKFYAQFMTYEGDSSGLAFSALMSDQAARGIDTRLMVDSYTDVVLSDVYPMLLHRLNGVREERRRTQHMFEWLQMQGVRVKRTAPPGFLARYMLFRDHKKMVLIDDAIAYVGGINISDHNYAWHDFMVRIEGPLVGNLLQDYCSTWEDGPTIALNQVLPGQDFVLNQCAGRYAIFDEVLTMIARAQQTIVIESPYLLGNHIECALRDAASRGVKVTLIIPAHSNKLVYRIWVRHLLRFLDHPNIRVYGYHGHGGMTHAKLLIVDNQWTTFGSFNMIELEGLTQKELNIFTSDSDFITQLNAFVANDLANATRIPVPRTTFGRFTFWLLYRFFKWWTQRLLLDPDWKAIYC